MAEFAPAKVNLLLHVTGRRPDGYHLLDSLAVFPAVGDQLEAMPADELTLEITGPFGGTLAAEPDNLVLRAARALAPGKGAALKLYKNLPVASGIGGGSADAAAALRLLAQLWGIIPATTSSSPDLIGRSTPYLGQHETNKAWMAGSSPAMTGKVLGSKPVRFDNLQHIAASLGADVPVCLASQAARMEGIGDILRAAPALPPCGVLLVNPGVAVPTPAVFKSRQGAFSPPATLPAGWPTAAAMAADLRALNNDLQAPAIALQPVIGEVLATLTALPGALLARMSGSGATCFALFATATAASAAAAAITPPNWWRWGGGLYEPHKANL
jgi:4-diphosphocytidyl-2-C-methyl-D-erythritol kinase